MWKAAAWGWGKDLMTKNTSLQAVLLIVVGLLFLVWGFLCGQRFGTGGIAAPPSILFPDSGPNLASTLKYRTNSWFWDGLHNWMDAIEGLERNQCCTLYTVHLLMFPWVSKCFYPIWITRTWLNPRGGFWRVTLRLGTYSSVWAWEVENIWISCMNLYAMYGMQVNVSTE